MSFESGIPFPETVCLHCGHKLNRASTSQGDYVPEPGDFTFCIRCAHVMCFTAELGLRELTAEEYAKAQENPLLQSLLKNTRLINRILERAKLAANAVNN